MQSIKAGLSLSEAFKMIDKVDSKIEVGLDYAFDNKYGYLTACPTNLGTGMRASSMLHLPGLVLSDQINKVIQAVNKIGLAVRGLYGEGTEALGNLFQVSNQHTLSSDHISSLSLIHIVTRHVTVHDIIIILISYLFLLIHTLMLFTTSRLQGSWMNQKEAELSLKNHLAVT